MSIEELRKALARIERLRPTWTITEFGPYDDTLDRGKRSYSGTRPELGGLPDITLSYKTWQGLEVEIRKTFSYRYDDYGWNIRLSISQCDPDWKSYPILALLTTISSPVYIYTINVNLQKGPHEEWQILDNYVMRIYAPLFEKHKSERQRQRLAREAEEEKERKNKEQAEEKVRGKFWRE